MKNEKKICLIGDVLIDVTLRNQDADTKLRLGGIVHAARTLWAMNISYDVAFFAPSYLVKQLVTYLSHHGCANSYQVGNVVGSPNVILIQESKEVGDQGYEFLLRDELSVEQRPDEIDKVVKMGYTDYLIISGNYDLVGIINKLSQNIHVDVANNIKDLTLFQGLQKKISTLFISTSSDIFKNEFSENFMVFLEKFEKFTNEIILKENRGGSRSYNFLNKQMYSAHSQPRKIAHSVGVGDAFDAAYIGTSLTKQAQKNVLASWVAAEYAVTSFPDDLKRGISRVLKSDVAELANIPGISLPWEKRRAINIYIAAPDFSFMNTTDIDVLEKALLYHNFSPRRPIQENGEMEANASKARKQELYTKDISLLEECSLLIAVLLNSDPGTLIEVGYAKGKGIPAIVYDPYKSATNCMLTELPDFVSSDIEEIISEVFSISSNLISNGN